MKKSETILCRLLLAVMLIIFAVLTVWSFRMTGVNADCMDETISWVYDSPMENVAGLLAFILALCAWLFAVKKVRSTRRLAIAAAITMGILSAVWVTVSKTAPQWDQAFLHTYACQFNDGDFSGLTSGNYAAMCQHQLGLITLMRLLYRIFGQDYRVFQYANACVLPFMAYGGYVITSVISKEHEIAQKAYVFLSFLYVPVYIYTAFVYGEIISITCCMLAVALFLKGSEHFALKYVIPMALLLAVAVGVRSNSLIVVIALAGVSLVKLIIERKKFFLILLAAVLLSFPAANAVTDCLYPEVNPDDSIPSVLYIAMGLNQDSANPGAYNWYNFNTFAACGYDAEAASATAKSDIAGFLDVCREDPQYLAAFLWEKVKWQWNAPMQQCLVMNNVFTETPQGLVASIYTGRLYTLLGAFMNIWQLFVYAAVLLFLILQIRKCRDLTCYAGLVILLGGLLFSMMWEAKPRYILPYVILMIPYAAVGFAPVCDAIKKRLAR